MLLKKVTAAGCSPSSCKQCLQVHRHVKATNQLSLPRNLITSPPCSSKERGMCCIPEQSTYAPAFQKPSNCSFILTDGTGSVNSQSILLVNIGRFSISLCGKLPTKVFKYERDGRHSDRYRLVSTGDDACLLNSRQCRCS